MVTSGEGIERNRARRIIGLSVIAALVVGAATPRVIEYGQAWYDAHEAAQARKVVAARYASCTLTSVVDRHVEPTVEFPGSYVYDPKGRTTLSLKASVTETPAARPALAQYEHNDAVVWPADGPQLTGRIVNRDGTLGTTVINYPHAGNDNGSVEGALLPYDNKPAGTTIAVFATYYAASAGMGGEMTATQRQLFCGDIQAVPDGGRTTFVLQPNGPTFAPQTEEVGPR